MDIRKRFESKFTKCEGCWEWKAGKQTKGYGSFWTSEKTLLAHRFSYQMYVGEIPDGLCVCHHCDNPLCVNPAHLFLGTNTDNIHDCMDKGRCVRAFGEKHWNTKLTEEQVKTIKARRNNGERGIDLAKEFGVSQPHICDIVHDRYWKNLL